MKPCFVSSSFLPSHKMIKSCLIKIASRQKQLLKERFLSAYMSGDKMILKYKTKGGYFIRSSFNVKGICFMKEYFKKYDIKTGKLSDYLFTRRIRSLFQ